MTGHLTLVGVGPGDPDLITLKAVAAIQTAGLIAYPVTPSGRALARDIARPHLPESCVEWAFEVPMSVDPAPAQAAYDAAAGALATHLGAGQSVVVLCEGDPFFYGSAMYLHDRLVGRFPITVVPGVTSLSAASAAAGRPLARRDEVFVVAPATAGAERLDAAFAVADSVAVMKVGRHMATVRDTLAAGGLNGNAVLAEKVGWPEQRIAPLGQADQEPGYFSLVLTRKSEREDA
ncbi:MAG: precorrin-2 C(20)-methyltransferase [Pseudomonadota bacterium]